MPAKIDWNDLTDAFNNMFHTDFANCKQMLLHLYNERKLGYKPIGDMLGVSDAAVRNKIIELKIKRKKPGGSYRPKKAPKRDAFLAIPRKEAANMTIVQLARRTGCTVEYISYLASKYKREIVKLKSPKGIRKERKKT